MNTNKFANEPTVGELRDIKGPSFLIFISVILIPAAILLWNPVISISVIAVCAAMLILGFILIFMYRKANRKIFDALEKQHCEVTCPCCHSKLQYLGIHTNPHRRWQGGYITCPRCRKVIGHTTDCIKSVE